MVLFRNVPRPPTEFDLYSKRQHRLVHSILSAFNSKSFKFPTVPWQQLIHVRVRWNAPGRVAHELDIALQDVEPKHVIVIVALAVTR